MPQAVLQFRDVLKCYGDYTAVDRLSFELTAGEFFTLLGPSGCGKTTTLRLVAGLEDPDDGEILLNGAPIASPKRGILVPPDKRQMGMVFQSYAIWPHMTVFENVAFPLRVRAEGADSLRKKVLDALALVGLDGLHERGATSLSGGQQQRGRRGPAGRRGAARGGGGEPLRRPAAARRAGSRAVVHADDPFARRAA